MRLLTVFLVVALSLNVVLVPNSYAVIEWLEENLDEGSVMGLGVMYSTRPYRDVDASVFPVPLLKLKYKRFYVDGTSLGLYLNTDEQFKFSVVGAPRFWGYEPDDSSALVGMTKRKATFDGGGRVGWVNELFTLEVTALTDLTGEHEGQEVSAFIKHKFLEGGFTPRIGVRWMSEDMIDYYYGVETSEARVGRPAYSPDSTANFVAGAAVAVPIGEKWAWISDVQVQILGDEIQDSPIVEDDNMFTIVSGLVYRF